MTPTIGVVKYGDLVRDSRKEFERRFRRRESAIRKESRRITGAPVEEHRPSELRFPAPDSPANYLRLRSFVTATGTRLVYQALVDPITHPPTALGRLAVAGGA